MKVFLVGFSGSGKTTIGPRLAKLLGCTYFDTDSEIERASKMTIPELFLKKGEATFRDHEYRTIVRITGKRRGPAVISLGGGAFAALRNRQVANKAGVVVYLRCELNELYRRLKSQRDRPLLFGSGTARKDVLAQMRILLQKRKQYYKMADITVSTTKSTPQRAAEDIMHRLREYGY